MSGACVIKMQPFCSAPPLLFTVGSSACDLTPPTGIGFSLPIPFPSGSTFITEAALMVAPLLYILRFFFFNEQEKMDLDGVSCPSPMATTVPLLQVCTTIDISQGFFQSFL